MADFSLVLAQLYQRHQGSLRKLVARKGLIPADAEDAVQDAFVRLLAKGASVEVASPIGLLTRTLLNIVTDRWRSSHLRGKYHEPSAPLDSLPANDASPEETAEARQLCQRLCAAIDRLPPRCREVFVLHRLEGLSHTEIAAQLGISRNMVEKHMVRALLDMRRILDDTME